MLLSIRNRMEGIVRNVHTRTIDAPLATVSALIDRIAADDDPLWPAPAWVPMRLDRPVGVGASGGHGPIRYEVIAYEPGRRVRFRFAPSLGLDGWHEVRVTDNGDARCVLTHEINAQPRGAMRLLWPLVIRPLHDAVIEDLLDNAELAATGRLDHPARWSPWVRLLRSRFERPVRTVPIPANARLAGDAFTTTDLADAYAVDLPDHVSRDPQAWHAAMFRSFPTWVGAALRLRNALAPLVGIDQGDASSFDPLASTRTEVLAGVDERHLDFRASILVDDDTVTLSTVARANNQRGRAYLALVKVFHPTVVRAMLRRAVNDMTARAPSAGRRALDRRRTSTPI